MAIFRFLKTLVFSASLASSKAALFCASSRWRLDSWRMAALRCWLISWICWEIRWLRSLHNILENTKLRNDHNLEMKTGCHRLRGLTCNIAPAHNTARKASHLTIFLLQRRDNFWVVLWTGRTLYSNFCYVPCIFLTPLDAMLLKTVYVMLAIFSYIFA